MDAARVIDRCVTLAACTEDPGKITRTFLSPPMREVHRLVGRWMSEAGMQVSVDAVGNIRGVWGSGPRLMIGSHLDTVPHAGAFDGILGVMLGIELVEAVKDRALVPYGIPAPYGIEVVGFSDEEGVRFGVPFIGSRALVGDPVMDDTVLEAIRAFDLDPDEIPKAAIGKDIKGYLEFHIEQGPVLEENQLALGVVDAIVGQARAVVEFHGKAGHAGTTPMESRKDALAAAAEWIAVVEKVAIEEQLVATVGRLDVRPGAVNVIPGVARATLDVRHKDTLKLERAMKLLETSAEEISTRRRIKVCWEQRSVQAAVAMDPAMTEVLASAVKAACCQPYRLSSGAGHDAMILARKVPAAMLFLRSPGGISHHPDERVNEGDVASALAAGKAFLETWRPA
ncbi:Amidase, hydantoinase/carbamoylase family [Candidatus Sulfopaludibacter sp. SbA6]|nr:Amidase, hydantoinase/carbamoylase family [Candidatus Sulfopaludibacter sp. SbA6]